jgi:hypothetical protein
MKKTKIDVSPSKQICNMTIRIQKRYRNRINAILKGSGQKQQEVIERMIAWYADHPDELNRFFQ